MASLEQFKLELNDFELVIYNFFKINNKNSYTLKLLISSCVEGKETVQSKGISDNAWDKLYRSALIILKNKILIIGKLISGEEYFIFSGK